jgi:enamine deaminase RidA (YjgF/YER057c/UK114 family)
MKTLRPRKTAHLLPAAAMLALLPGAACAQSAAPAPQPGARAQAEVLMSDNPGARQFQENWGFSDAVISGDMIYLSGIVAGQRPGEELSVAYDRVYRQIGAILKRAGASWDDVIDLSSFHTDVEGQIEAMAKVHKTYVKAPYPAWTAIGVAKILGNGITEIKVVARRPQPRAAR